MPSCQLTLTTSGTAYNLFNLLTGVTAGADRTHPNISPSGVTLNLQADPGNSGNVYVGGNSNVSSSAYGLKLLPGDSFFRSTTPLNGVSLTTVYLVADANSQKVDVLFDFI